MKMQRVAGTDLQVSRLAYGCMEIHRAGSLDAVHAALDQGINFFDHADIYGAGRSEAAFSGIWQEVPGLRARVVVQSKCGIRLPGDGAPGPRYDFSYQHIIWGVNGSLQRLGTDYLDLLLLHRPDPLVEPEEVARAFDELHAAGKVRYFGVSNHTAAQIELLRRYVRQPLVANQVEISLLHSQMFESGIIFNQEAPDRPVRNEGTLEYCRLHDIALQAWSPLARGRLTGKPIPEGDERLERAGQVVARYAEHYAVSGEAILLAWLLRHPAHVQPIIGSTNPERVAAACRADRVDLSREEWYELFLAGRGAPLP